MSNVRLVAQQIAEKKFTSVSIARDLATSPLSFLDASAMPTLRCLRDLSTLVGSYEKRGVDFSAQDSLVSLVMELAQEKYALGVDYLARTYGLSSEITEIVAPNKFSCS